VQQTSYLPAFGHLTWLSLPHEVSRPARLAIEQRQSCWSINYLRHSRRAATAIDVIRQGRRHRVALPLGGIRFAVPDDETYTFVGSVLPGDRYHTILIPRLQFPMLAAAEGLAAVPQFTASGQLADRQLRCCLERFLFDPAAADGRPDTLRQDQAARQLVVRLCELAFGIRPDWSVDQSKFEQRTLQRLVELIDANLAVPPSAAHCGAAVGLSPGHFARKFRRSTGCSLDRFVNRRRVLAAANQLRQEDLPLSQLATDLGFASQSHFTRCFSDCTGVPPGRFRRAHRKTCG